MKWWKRAKPLPTDHEILEAIYARYYDQFVNFSKPAQGHPAKAMFSIDIKAIANDCGTDPDIVFARLYYKLQEEHGFVREDEIRVPFFEPHGIADAPHCIHFPLMTSVLAPLRAEERKHSWEFRLSMAAFVISLISLVLSSVK